MSGPLPEIADSGIELDALAELDPAQQRRAVLSCRGWAGLWHSRRQEADELRRAALTPSPKAAQQVEDTLFAALMRAGTRPAPPASAFLPKLSMPVKADALAARHRAGEGQSEAA